MAQERLCCPISQASGPLRDTEDIVVVVYGKTEAEMKPSGFSDQKLRKHTLQAPARKVAAGNLFLFWKKFQMAVTWLDIHGTVRRFEDDI